MRFAFSFSSCGVMLRAVARNEERTAVQKDSKLFIGEKFVRSESGRVAPARGTRSDYRKRERI